MKFKSLFAVVTLVLSTQAHAQISPYGDIDLNEMQCYNKIGAVSCSSSGYWEGRNAVECKVSVSYKSVYNTRRNEIATLTSFGYSVVNTGFLGAATLGIADAIANQGAAIKARSEATSEINRKIRNIKSLVPVCRF